MKTSNIQIIILALKSGPKIPDLKRSDFELYSWCAEWFCYEWEVFVGQDIDDSTGQQNGSIKGSGAVESLRKYNQLVYIGKDPSRNAHKCLCAWEFLQKTYT